MKKKKTEKNNSYLLSVKCMGKLWKSEGDTLENAIANLGINYAKGMGVWTVEKDGVKREKVVRPIINMRLFNSRGLMRDVVLKQFKLMFNL